VTRTEYWVMREEDIPRERGGLVVHVRNIPVIAMETSYDDALGSLAEFTRLNPQFAGSYTIVTLTLETSRKP
jgi:hypothetical protein